MVTTTNNNTVGSENYGIKYRKLFHQSEEYFFDHQNKDQITKADRRRKRKKTPGYGAY